MRKLFTTTMLFIILITSAYADITWTGDARVRPRLDIIDLGSYGNQTDNIYYFYRARLNMKADIGDGYFFKTTLSYNGAANFAKFGTGTTPVSSVSLASAGRSPLSFMEVYFGQQNQTFGWAAGIIRSMTCISTQERWPTFPGYSITMRQRRGLTSTIAWLVANLT